MNGPLNAGDICTRIVTIAHAGMSASDAARLMRERHVGALVVVEEAAPDERVVVGMLTDRDLMTAVVADERDAHSVCVGELMSRDLVTAREQDSLLDVLAAMRRKGVRRVPVTGARDRLIGLIALDDVLEVVAEQMRAVAAAIGASQRHEQAARG